MNSTDIDNDKFVFAMLDEPNALLVLIPAHFVTVSFLCVLAKIIHERAPMAHPVYAVAFQEVIVLVICAITCLCVLITIACGNPLNIKFMVYIEPPLIAMQIHQVSWLMITALRYYLLIINDDVDLSRLTSKCCAAVWAVSIPYYALCHLPSYAMFTAHNWPRVRVNSLDAQVLMLSMVATNIIYNVPDYISIALYLKMWRRLRDHTQVQPQIELPYGGIWVGGNLDHPPIEAAANSNNTIGNDNQNDKAESIFSKLGLHVSVALLDMVMFFLASMSIGNIVGRVLLHVHIVIFCYWIPFIVIKNNFKQLH